MQIMKLNLAGHFTIMVQPPQKKIPEKQIATSSTTCPHLVFPPSPSLLLGCEASVAVDRTPAHLTLHPLQVGVALVETLDVILQDHDILSDFKNSMIALYEITLNTAENQSNFKKIINIFRTEIHKCNLV